MKFMIQRFIKSVLTILAVLLFVFIGTRLTGSPITAMYPDGLTEESLAAFNEKYGLDKSISEQFVLYIRNILFEGNFGVSIHEGRPVTEIYADAAWETLKLGSIAFVVSIIIGVAIGIIISLFKNNFITKILSFIVGVGYSTPSFIIAIFLILIFSYQLQLLPSMGGGSALNYIMPVIALSINPIATIARYVNTSFVEVLSQEYMKTAISKGLGTKLVLFKHGFKNILIPLITVMGILVVNIVGGSIVVETVFTWPGVGNRLVGSVMSKDYPVVQFGVICFSIVVIFVNFIIDILYGIIDPRIKRGQMG